MIKDCNKRGIGRYMPTGRKENLCISRLTSGNPALLKLPDEEITDINCCNEKN